MNTKNQQPGMPQFPERDESAQEEQQGLYRKFEVRRVDGSDKPGGKHDGCAYFVLDIDHDPHAPAALSAYAAACEASHRQLAADLRQKWGALPVGQNELTKRLMQAARQDALTWQDRFYIGQAIAHIQASQADSAVREVPEEPEEPEEPAPEMYVAAPHAAVPEPFQALVQPWLLACFGEMIAGDREERNHRFLEESLELVQSCGCTACEAHQLVDYVFGRPVGEPPQEVGGVMVTLAALCLANGLDMHDAAEVELARIWTQVEAIRAKQAAKPKHSPLPAAPHAAAVPAPAGRSITTEREKSNG